MYPETVFYPRYRLDQTAPQPKNFIFLFFPKFFFFKIFLAKKITFSKYGGYKSYPYRVFYTYRHQGSRSESSPHIPNLGQVVGSCRVQTSASIADFANDSIQIHSSRHDTKFLRRSGDHPVPQITIPYRLSLRFRKQLFQIARTPSLRGENKV